MIKLRIKIKSLNGETYSNDEELHDDYMVSRQNPDFLKLVQKNIEKSHIEEIDYVKAIANFGEI